MGSGENTSNFLVSEAMTVCLWTPPTGNSERQQKTQKEGTGPLEKAFLDCRRKDKELKMRPCSKTPTQHILGLTVPVGSPTLTES